MGLKYTKFMLFLTACSLLTTACCSSQSNDNKAYFKERFKNTQKYTIQIKYGNEDWQTFHNVVEIRKPNRYRNVLSIKLDDGTIINTVGAVARWTDQIPEY